MQNTQFKDVKGHLWTLSINIKHYIQIKQQYGIDLSDVFSKDDNWLAKLAAQDDLMMLVEIICLLTEADREKAGISQDDFYDRLDGDSVEAATIAFIQAIVLFLPAHKQTAMKTVIEAMEVGMAKTIKTMEDSKEMILDQIEQKMDEGAKQAFEDLK